MGYILSVALKMLLFLMLFLAAFLLFCCCLTYLGHIKIVFSELKDDYVWVSCDDFVAMVNFDLKYRDHFQLQLRDPMDKTSPLVMINTRDPNNYSIEGCFTLRKVYLNNYYLVFNPVQWLAYSYWVAKVSKFLKDLYVEQELHKFFDRCEHERS